MGLNSLIDFFNPDRVQPALERAFDETKDEYAGLQKIQLSEGEMKNSNPIHRKGAPPDYIYALITVQHKLGMAGLSGVTSWVTFHDTGDFYRSIFAERKGTNIELNATDWKVSLLEADYGNFWGVGKKYMPDYIKYYYLPAVKKALNL